MVSQGGTCLNHLLKELADWEEQLKRLDKEISILQSDTMEGLAVPGSYTKEQ